jgi:hypothetical protein
MNTSDITVTLSTLFDELLNGPAAQDAYMLNAGDRGLVRSIDALTAADASEIVSGGSSIAAHVDHLRYGLSLMNRWSTGENPFSDADWAASWRKTTVSEPEWQQLRRSLRGEAERWLQSLATPKDVSTTELSAIVGSIAHLAYHLGAIRQMNRSARGPLAEEPQPKSS